MTPGDKFLIDYFADCIGDNQQLMDNHNGIFAEILAEPLYNEIKTNMRG